MPRLSDPLLDDDEFARLMALLGPFEHAPSLAVAVSGGADSMALTLLAGRWAAARQGQVLALTVDHGLRPESAAEARQVGAWLAARGIAHRVLSWTGSKPATGIQAAARDARYRLLLDCCREAGILHLLLAHHRDDQAETVALRHEQKSGRAGLAGMAPIVPTPGARLLRPLLAVPKARLQDFLTGLGQAWIEDPSNRNLAFRRVQARARLAGSDEAGDLAIAADAAAAERAGIEAEAAALLASSAIVSPAGFVRIDARPLTAAGDALGRHVLGSILRTVGGGIYPPRGERLERLWTELKIGLDRRRSLAGCLVSPSSRGLLIHREPAGAGERIMTGPAAGPVHWDGRFLLHLAGSGQVTVRALGMNEGPRRGSQGLDIPAWPAAVRAALPALFDDQGLAAVPHFGWRRGDFAGPIVTDWSFAPSSPLTGGLVWHHESTMC